MPVSERIPEPCFAAVVSSAMDAIILTDQQQRITVFNAAAEQIFRCPAGQALGQPINKFIPERFRAAHERHVDEYGRSSATKRSMYNVGEVKGLRADGEEFPAEATISHGSANGEKFFAVILRDVSERKKCELLGQMLQKMEAEEALRLYRHDLATATAMQQQFLSVAVPEVDFASITYASLPNEGEIGGDFLDFVRTPAGVAVVLGDACGKGLRAAILGSILRAMIHGLIQTGTPLSRIAGVCNDFLCRKHLEDASVTAVLAHITPAGELEFVNCGHVPPFLVSGAGVRRLRDGDIPLGFIPQVAYQSAHIQLHSGDRLVLVTDGLIEAEDRAGESFGEQRAEEAACNPCHDLVSAVRQFRGGSTLADDCTIVEFAYHGMTACQHRATSQGG